MHCFNQTWKTSTSWRKYVCDPIRANKEWIPDCGFEDLHRCVPIECNRVDHESNCLSKNEFIGYNSQSGTFGYICVNMHGSRYSENFSLIVRFAEGLVVTIALICSQILRYLLETALISHYSQRIQSVHQSERVVPQHIVDVDVITAIRLTIIPNGITTIPNGMLIHKV